MDFLLINGIVSDFVKLSSDFSCYATSRCRVWHMVCFFEGQTLFACLLFPKGQCHENDFSYPRCYAVHRLGPL